MHSLHRYLGTIRFFHRHQRLAHTTIGKRELRRARIWVHVIRRELAETRAALRPPTPSLSNLWVADAICETGHNPPNWRFHVGVYQGGIAFWYGTWDSWKVNVRGAAAFAEADQAPPWIQAAVAQWGLDHYGRWGCLFHADVWSARDG